jgi:hypothetical protein
MHAWVNKLKKARLPENNIGQTNHNAIHVHAWINLHNY